MRIYVANFPYETTQEELKKLFEASGTVTSVDLMVDKQTGRARGFGFVEMPDATQGAAAIAALNGKDVGGRPLKVNEAQPKTSR